VVRIFSYIDKQHDVVLHNTNKDCLYVKITSPVPWRAWILFYQFAWGCLLARLLKARLTLHVKNSFVLLVVQFFFLLLMWVHGAFFVNVQRTCCHMEQLVQGLDLMLKGLARWVVNPSNHLVTWIGINLRMILHPMKYHKPIIWTPMHIP